MVPDFIAFCSDGKVYFTCSRDAALACANVTKVLEIAPQGQAAVLVATASGSPTWTIAGLDAAGSRKQHK